jgi:hypothetical protein
MSWHGLALAPASAAGRRPRRLLLLLLLLLHSDNLLRWCLRRVAVRVSHLNDLHLIVDLNGFTFRH